jgi:hypothetical protein
VEGISIAEDGIDRFAGSQIASHVGELCIGLGAGIVTGRAAPIGAGNGAH